MRCGVSDDAEALERQILDQTRDLAADSKGKAKAKAKRKPAFATAAAATPAVRGAAAFVSPLSVLIFAEPVVFHFVHRRSVERAIEKAVEMGAWSVDTDH